MGEKSKNNDTVSKIGCGFITIVLIIGTIWAIISSNDNVIWFAIASGISVICLISLFIGSHNSKTNKIDYDIKIQSAKDALNKLSSSKQTQKDILSSYIESLEIIKQIEEEQLCLEKMKEKNQTKYKELIYEREVIIEDLNKKFEKCKYDSCADTDDYIINKYIKLCDTFEKTNKSQKVAYLFPDCGESNTKITKDVFDFIKCPTNVPALQIPQTNETVYFYPRFILLAKSDSQFDIFPIENVSIKATQWSVGWIPLSDVPSDCYNVSYKYKYSNKDGSPDLRYHNNCKLAYPRYCAIQFSFAKGLLLISNKVIASELADALVDYFKLFNPNNQSFVDFNVEGNTDSISYLNQELKKTLNDVNELAQKTKELDETFTLKNKNDNPSDYIKIYRINRPKN